VIACPDCEGVSPLCDRCVDEKFDQLCGTAGARGYAWGQQVAAELERRGRTLPPWPAFAGRCREIAMRKIAGLVDDARLLQQLAQACWKDARRRYEQLRGA